MLRDVRDPDEAEDVTQIAFLNAFRALRRGEQPEKPRAWLVMIARNVVRRRYRAQALRPQEVSLDPEVAADLMDLEGPTAGEIAGAIRSLPPNQRAVILLREIQGRTYAEIAEELDLSIPAVETLIFRARGGLSERLKLVDYVPATQEKRQRRLRGLLALPLPGLGKISLGFSVSRAATAALVGGVVIVTVPVADVAGVADVAADRPLAPAVQRAPSFAERGGPVVSFTSGAPPRVASATHRAPSRHKKAAAGGEATGSDSSVGGSVSLPAVGLPAVDPTLVVPELPPLPPLPIEPPDVQPLPIEPPDVPPLPPPPDLGPLG